MNIPKTFLTDSEESSGETPPGMAMGQGEEKIVQEHLDKDWLHCGEGGNQREGVSIKAFFWSTPSKGTFVTLEGCLCVSGMILKEGDVLLSHPWPHL